MSSLVSWVHRKSVSGSINHIASVFAFHSPCIFCTTKTQHISQYARLVDQLLHFFVGVMNFAYSICTRKPLVDHALTFFAYLSQPVEAPSLSDGLTSFNLQLQCLGHTDL